MTKDDLTNDIANDQKTLTELKASIANEVTRLQNKINANKSSLKKLIENDAYADFDQDMRNYYTHQFNNEVASDWYDFASHTSFFDSIIDKEQLSRHFEYNIEELLFDYGALDDALLLNGVSQEIIDKLGRFGNGNDYKLKSLSDVPENDRKIIKSFVNDFCKLEGSRFKWDW